MKELFNARILLTTILPFITFSLFSQVELINNITVNIGESETITSGEALETNGNVTINGDGINGGSLNLVSRKSITLKPGFTASAGSRFSASIQTAMVVETDQDMNWTQVVSYDEHGLPVSWSKSYVDELGRPLQSQSFSFENYKAVVSQSLYDDLGRVAITSMAVPVTQDKLQYLPGFIQNENGEGFNINNNQETVSANQNQLGWYYSNNNPEEYIDHSSFPYSKLEYSSTQPGAVRKSSMPGESHKMGSGHEKQSYTMRVSDYEIDHFLKFDKDIETKGLVKKIFIDSDGKQFVTYYNADGAVIANCTVGNITEDYILATDPPFGGRVDMPDNPIKKYEPVFYMYDDILRYFDVHVSPGGRVYFVCEGTYSITNLGTDEVVNNNYVKTRSMFPAADITTPGFYRVRFKVGLPPNTSLCAISWQNYYNYALNVYDKAGRLKKSYTPLATENNDPSYCTTYTYNSLDWLIKAESKDEGASHFVYRKDGQILFSQNAQQKIDGKFSYSIYDENVRIIESGEYDESYGSLRFWNSGVLALSESNELSPNLRENTSVPYLTQRHKIWYGEEGNTQNQHFVLGAISKTEYDNNITYYSYTYDGKVDWVIRDHAYLGAKKIEYTYDFLGNVTEVGYQRGASDQFIHYYTYNEDQKLKEAYTKRGSGSKQLQAKYKYYAHGALKRVEIAQDQQGIDYVYNLNGMLKSINHPNLDKNLDPGKDGSNGFRQDLFALALDYYAGDYSGNSNVKTSGNITSNYSGNISMLRWNQYNNKALTGQQWAYKVGYNDQNYLEEAVFGSYSHSSNIFTGDEDYKVNNLIYDAHGNIQTLNRNGYGGYRNMDNLQYHYSSANANRLAYINDNFGSTPLQDIASQGANNYQYNVIGQMTSNAADNINFNYDVTGKVSSYTIPGGDGNYYYDDAGFRSTVETVNGERTHYVRDLSGNIMAVYNGSGTVLEYPIYGNDRIGMAFENGGALAYNYELKDHLGNVRATFSKSDLIDATGYADYYPFGWKMPNRMADAANKYRFGYQGQFAEYDDEAGLNQFEARLYDSRIGRWLTNDPAGQYASPYMAMGNSPFATVDPDGRYDLPKNGWQRFWNSFTGRGNLNLPLQSVPSIYGVAKNKAFMGYEGGEMLDVGSFGYLNEITVSPNYVGQAAISGANKTGLQMGIIALHGAGCVLNPWGMGLEYAYQFYKADGDWQKGLMNSDVSNGVPGYTGVFVRSVVTSSNASEGFNYTTNAAEVSAGIITGSYTQFAGNEFSKLAGTNGFLNGNTAEGLYLTTQKILLGYHEINSGGN